MPVISAKKILCYTEEKLLAFLQNLFCTEDLYILMSIFSLNLIIPGSGSSNQN